MAAPDPEGMSLFAKVVATGAALAPLGGFWIWLDNRFAKKHTVTSQLQAVTGELATQRGHIGKIFEQMRDMEKVSEERHRELMMHLLEKRK